MRDLVQELEKRMDNFIIKGTMQDIENKKGKVYIAMEHMWLNLLSDGESPITDQDVSVITNQAAISTGSDYIFYQELLSTMPDPSYYDNYNDDFREEEN